MKSIIVNGLFIVLICSVSTRFSKASSASSVEGDYEDEYHYDDDYEYDDNSPTPRNDDYEFTSEASETVATKPSTLVHNVTEVTETPSNVLGDQETKTESLNGVILEEIEIPLIENCPKWCTCDEQLQFIDCSNHSLSEIPKNLPNTSLHINLSNNDIREIHESELTDLTVVREIILKNNKIQHINGSVFRPLHRLDTLDLSSNDISKIDPDVFEHAQGLSLLTLNNNPIAFEENRTFLNLPNLEILNLVGCNITTLYNETFANLTGLSSLNLANNSFIGDVNVDAFNTLNSLLKLKIPHVSRTATYGLCEKISVIDVISFDKYNISCYELISGSTYDESTITHRPTALVETTTVPLRAASTTPISVVVVTENSTPNPKPNVTEIPEIGPKMTDDETISTVNALNTTSGDGNVKSEKVEKSTQSIKTILIASIAIAVLGLVIGLICRKDVFGVKTKLCRTQRPEQPTIPEQVPLNKV